MTPDVLRLFPDFRAASWRPWRTFKAALDGRPVHGEALELFQRCTGRQRLPTAPVVEAYAIVGRRGGKSRLAAALAVEAAVLRDWRPHLAPGEWATIAIVASDRPQSRNVLQYVEGLVDACPPLAAQVVRRSAESIEFTGRARVEVTTASARGTRGYSFACVICDELAYWRSESTTEPDTEVLAAVRPGLSTLPGARLVCISSPYSRRGALWQAFRSHYGREDDPVLVWCSPTATMNPVLPARIIEAAYEADPVAAAAEYGAQFRTDVAGFVDREVLEGCVVPGRQGLRPLRDLTYHGFVDPSGGSQDSFALAIAHLEDQDGLPVAVHDVPVDLDQLRVPKPARTTLAERRDAVRARYNFSAEDVAADPLKQSLVRHVAASEQRHSTADEFEEALVAIGRKHNLSPRVTASGCASAKLWFAPGIRWPPDEPRAATGASGAGDSAGGSTLRPLLHRQGPGDGAGDAAAGNVVGNAEQGAHPAVGEQLRRGRDEAVARVPLRDDPHRATGPGQRDPRGEHDARAGQVYLQQWAEKRLAQREVAA